MEALFLLAEEGIKGKIEYYRKWSEDPRVSEEKREFYKKRLEEEKAKLKEVQGYRK